MTLTVLLPSQVLFTEAVAGIRAEAENGWFGILPRHIDFVTALVPGVLAFQPCGQAEQYLAIDRGILVKCGPEVTVSTRNAVRGASLPLLRQNTETQFRQGKEREKQARVLEAKLEADLARHLLEAEKNA